MWSLPPPPPQAVEAAPSYFQAPKTHTVSPQKRARKPRKEHARKARRVEECVASGSGTQEPAPDNAEQDATAPQDVERSTMEVIDENEKREGVGEGVEGEHFAGNVDVSAGGMGGEWVTDGERLEEGETFEQMVLADCVGFYQIANRVCVVEGWDTKRGEGTVSD